jgi:predicted hydrocarbon binding protein
MNSIQTPYYYPNKMGRIVLAAMEETLGSGEMKDLLHHSCHKHRIDHLPPNNFALQYSFEELSQLQTTLEEMYGIRSGRGLALRSGRACFKYGLREFGPLLGLTELSFRLLPFDVKLRAGADLFADMFNRYSDQRVRIEENGDRLLWHIDRCPICWGRRSQAPVCHLAVGILQEAAYWVSGGKFFPMEEVLCIARGDPTCTIAISKTPLH